MPRLNLKSGKSRWLAGTVVLIGLVLFFGAWRPVYVAWKIRSAKALMNMGSIGRAQDALRQLELARIQQPENPELIYLLARANRRTGDVEKSLEYLRMAESAGWDRELVQQQKQLALFQRGHIDDSATLDHLLRQNASDELAYEVYESLAKGYMFSYRFSDALHCLDFWSEWCSDAADPRMWRAQIWEQSERWEKANSEYREVLKRDPGHQEARQSLARILLLEQNKAEEAYREFQISLGQSPDDFNAQLGMATCERRMANPEGAEVRIRALLNRDLTPQQLASVRMEMGQILLDRRALPEAIAMLTSVVEADPLNSTAHYVLGCAHAASGDQESAQKCFEWSRIRGEQFSRLTTITTELVNHPEKPDLRWEAGRILMDQGMHTEGAAWMSTALIYDPEHRATHESLAEYYRLIKPDERLAQLHREKASASK